MASPTTRIARTLDIRPSEARLFAEAVRKKLDRQVAYKQIAQTLESLPSWAHRPRYVARAMQVGNEKELSRYLDRLVERVGRRLEAKVGRSLDGDVAARAVAAIGLSPFPKEVDGCARQLLILLDIAADLRLSLHDAWEYADDVLARHGCQEEYEALQAAVRSLPPEARTTAQVERAFAAAIVRRRLQEMPPDGKGGRVTDEELAAAAATLGDPAPTAQRLAARVLAGRLAAALQMPLDTILAFESRHRQATGEGAPYPRLLAMLPECADPSGQIDSFLVLHSWFVSLACGCELERARRLIEGVRQEVAAEITVAQWRRALAETANPGCDAAALAESILRQQVEAVLEEPARLPELREEVAAILDRPVPLRRLWQVAHQIEQPSYRAIVDAFLAGRPLARIAEALGVSLQEARKATRRIGQRATGPVDDQEILHALQTAGRSQRTVAGLVDIFDVRTVAAATGSTEADVDKLIERLQKQGNGRWKRRQVLDALWHACRRGGPVGEAVALMEIAEEMGTGVAQAVSFVRAVRRKSNHGHTIGACREALRSLPDDVPRDLVEETVAIYLMMPEEKRLAPDEHEQIGDLLVGHGVDKSLKKRFLFLWGSLSGDALSAADAAHLLAVAGWPAEAMAFLRPDGEVGERWLAAAALPRLGRWKKWKRDRAQRQRQRWWREIRSDRRAYGVPSMGRAEILADRSLEERYGLRSLRFVQEGVRAPGVFIQFRFGHPARVGVLRIANDGDLSGFHLLAQEFAELFIAIALAYYRDLVVPERRTHIFSSASGAKKWQSRSGGGRKQAPRSPLPGRRGRPIYRLEEWYESQERARHWVRGHTREIGPGFVADDTKRRQARRAGVELPPGYTWVMQHERGSGPPGTRVPLNDRFDLIRPTLFYAPTRATAALSDLL